MSLQNINNEIQKLYTDLRDGLASESSYKNKEAFLLATKLAQKSTFSEFEKIIKSNDLPAIKLSEKEMTLIQGGIWPPIIILPIIDFPIVPPCEE